MLGCLALSVSPRASGTMLQTSSTTAGWLIPGQLDHDQYPRFKVTDLDEPKIKSASQGKRLYKSRARRQRCEVPTSSWSLLRTPELLPVLQRVGTSPADRTPLQPPSSSTLHQPGTFDTGTIGR
jgi:hypothetical protein